MCFTGVLLSKVFLYWVSKFSGMPFTPTEEITNIACHQKGVGVGEPNLYTVALCTRCSSHPKQLTVDSAIIPILQPESGVMTFLKIKGKH